MVARVKRAFIGLVALCMVACQPAVPSGTGNVPPVAGSTQHTTISVNINTVQGMATQARHRTIDDIHHFKIRLFTTGTDGNTASDAIATYVANVPLASYANPYAIPNISDGSYYLMVEAFDSNNMSITQPTTRFSLNHVVITGGAAIYVPSGTAVNVNLKLLDGNKGTGAAVVTMSPPAFIAPAVLYGLSLVNNRTSSVVAVEDFALNLNLKDLQEGDFDIWAFAGNSGTATLAKRKVANMTVQSDGVTTPSTSSWSFSESAFSTPNPANTYTVAGPVTVGKDGTVYYVSGSTIKKVGDPVFSINASSPPTALAIAPDGTLYYNDGLAIKRSDGTTMATTAASPSAMAVNASGAIYYAEALSIKKAGVSDAIATATSMPTAIGLDKVGNLYFADDGWIKMVVAKSGTYFATGAFTAGTTYNLNRIAGAVLGDIAVDPAGNIYATDFTNHRVVMMGAGGVAIFRVAGTGAAGTATTSTSALTAAITSPRGLAVTDNGELYFGSKDGLTYLLRKVM